MQPAARGWLCHRPWSGCLGRNPPYTGYVHRRIAWLFADADVTRDGGSLVFMLTRSRAVHAAGSVLFRTAGTAVAPSDYSAGVGRVRFAPSTQ